MSLPDFYGVLELTPDADLNAIKQAYRRLALQHHPDVNARGKDDNIKRINEAYAVLSDPTKRAAYDAKLQEEREEQMTWMAGLGGFVGGIKKELPTKRRMTWSEGMRGFMREMQREMRDDS
jgi:curved DNA-binding protein CbpA